MREVTFDNHFEKIFLITEFCEYDLKSLIETRVNLTQKQIKHIILQLLLGITMLHENYIIHRDIKTANILLNSKGVLKICDFGLSRFFFSEKIELTKEVVTLWYRAPEILLGSKKYFCSVDIWSVGCVLAEAVLNQVLFQGESELDQLTKIFNLLGTPTVDIWLNLHCMFTKQKIIPPIQPFNLLSRKFKKKINDLGLDLLHRFLTYVPSKRISARSALKHPFFLK